MPIGPNNKFTPGLDRGQPTLFVPGRQRSVFSFYFNGDNQVWKLGPRTATASRNSARCPTNQPPSVTAAASPNPTVVNAETTLTATAVDDGLPVGSALTYAWTVVSGPGLVDLMAAGSASTAAFFRAPGVYVMRVTVSDSQLSSSADVSVEAVASLLPGLSIADASIVEGRSGLLDAVATITLSPASSETVTVAWQSSDDTAFAGCDYLRRGGVVMFLPGETTQEVRVPVVGEALFEADERFFVTLAAASGATITDAQGSIVIANDDTANAPPTVPANRAPILGAAGVPTNATLSWSASDPEGTPLTFDVHFGTNLSTTGQKWQRQCAASSDPGPRAFSATAFDDATDRLFLFGGQAASGDTADFWILLGGTALGSTLEWSPIAARGPSARRRGVAAFAPASGRVLVHGGCAGTCASGVSDAWVLGGLGQGETPSWTSLPASPVALRDHAAAFDDATNSLIVFGGFAEGASTPNNDLWILRNADGAGTPAWQPLPVSGTRPPGRAAAAVALDARTNRLFVFGGRLANDAVTNDVWVLANANGQGPAAAWSKLEPAGNKPAARWGHRAGFDAVAGRLIVSGGTGTGFEAGQNFVSSDLWLLAGLDGASPAWTAVTPTGELRAGPRLGHALAYSANRNRGVVFGGINNRATEPLLADLWSLGGAIGTLPVVGQDSPDAVFAPENLTLNQRYFWRVAARDGAGSENGGALFDFTTGPPSLSIEDATVVEGNEGTRPARFMVRLSAPAVTAIEVTYTTAAGTAGSGVDFVPASGVVSIAPGATQATIDVDVIGDTTFEANETFSVTIVGAAGTNIARGEAVGTILNDDTALNAPPIVSAGVPRSIDTPGTNMEGVARDDGLPSGTLLVQWTLVEGPGEVLIEDPTDVRTAVTFTTIGDYRLRLTASDGELSAFSEVTINVARNLGPVVDAGPDQTTSPRTAVLFRGSVEDDGMPYGRVPTAWWTQVSGPVPVAFNPSDSPWTSITFSELGTYVLRLHGSDGPVLATDEVTVEVLPVNRPPTVSAGVDVSTYLKTASGLGKLVVNSDEWTLSDTGLLPDPTSQAFARNLGSFFSSSGPGHFLVYSSNFGLVENTLANTMRDAGHTWTIDASIPFTLENLLMFDGVFLTDVDPASPSVLRDYIEAGGNVYIAMGTGSLSATGEAAVWNPLLLNFGMRLKGDFYRNNASRLATEQLHPLFIGVDTLFFWGSNPVVLTNPDDPWLTAIDYAADIDEEPNTRIGIFEAFDGAAVRLTGTVADDGLPPGSSVTHTWSVVSGPAAAVIDFPQSLSTRVRFPVAGTYVLRLSASDGEFTTTDETTIVVAPSSNLDPEVSAGPDLTVTLPEHTATLNGSATDDGVPGGGLTVSWSVESGPAAVEFANRSALVTDATFPVAGTYRLFLAVSDGLAVKGDLVEVQVLPNSGPNAAPLVSAGPDVETGLRLNRIVNGGAEEPASGTELSGWVSYQGRWRQVATSEAFRGAAVFQASEDPNAYLRQDVFIADLAPLVDLGTLEAEIELRHITVPEAIPDGVSIHLEARSFDNSVVTASTSSPLETSVAGWKRRAVKLRLPAGTRWIRVYVITRARTGPTNDVRIDEVALRFGSAGVKLSGRVLDDALVFPQPTTQWSVLSGGSVLFSDPNAAITNAVFEAPGTYEVELSASDGELSAADRAVITVAPNNAPPVVETGPDTVVYLPSSTTLLTAQVTDDGRPGTTLTQEWTQIAGPGIATIATPLQLQTTVTLPGVGRYVFQLAAFDGEQTGADSVVVEVKASVGPNVAPVVSAGPDRQVYSPNDRTTLVGTVTDDGLPSTNLVTAWTQVAGPPGVGFAGFAATTTEVNFPASGTYVLRLTATDSLLSAHDDVTVVVSAPGENLRPVADAGPDSTITGFPATVALNGSFIDDGLPLGIAIFWQQASGPSDVTIQNPFAVRTSATLPTAGTYVFSLTVSDGAFTATDEVTVRVLSANLPPIVSAGPDRVAFAPRPGVATLNGSASDDGQPGDGLLFQWVQVAGPATAAIASPGAAITNVQFTTLGSYVFRLVASDGLLSSQDEVTVDVQVGNLPPVVNAGGDQNIALPVRSALLAGSVTDDGKPLGITVVTRWSQIAGPGLALFADPNATSTLATFDAPGTYVLRLFAHDTDVSAFDDVTLVVQGQAPTGDAPVVTLTAPVDLAEVTQPVTVTGSVSTDSILAWRLERRESGTGDTGWSPINTGTSTGESLTFGTLDPTLLLNGLHDVRVVTTDTSGRSAEAAIAVVVKDDMKLGHVALTFQDLDVPVSGIPIEVLRSYDSRDKSRGDFGFGWRLDVNRVRVHESSVMGRAFTAQNNGSFIPTWCIVPARNVVITVVTPDGVVHRFRPVAEDSCALFSPPDFATIRLEPIGGTSSSLTMAGGSDVLVQQGESGGWELWSSSDGDFQLLDPRRFTLTLSDGRKLSFDQFDGFESIRDPNGNQLTFGPGGITHSSGKSITFLRDGEGRISKITDPSGKAHHYAYDVEGNLASYTDPTGNVTVFTYVPSRPHHLRDVIDARGVRALRNDFDADGRLISTTDALGKALTYSYDMESRRETIVDRNGHPRVFEYDTQGFVTREVDQEGGVTTRTFDDRGNRLTEIDASGRERRWTYDGLNNVLTERDPAGALTTNTYGPFARLLTTTDALGHTRTNLYYDNGNQRASEGPLPLQQTSFDYDPQGNMTVMLTPTGLTSWSFDASGNRLTETDASGHTTTFTYDANGRVLTETRTRSTPSGLETLLTTHEYDAQGRETKTTDPDGTFTRRTYDPIGNVTSETDKLGRVTAIVYDDNARLSRRTYPDTTFEEYSYDNEGRQTSMRDRAGRVTTMAYDKTGRLTRTTYVDGSFTTRSYDGAGRVLTSFDPARGTTTFEYDEAGRVSKERDALGNERTFTYDLLGQQTRVRDERGHETSYVYDAAGRRTKVIAPDLTEKTTEYDLGDRVVAEVDEDGQRTAFGYDSLSRLTSVLDAASQVTIYGYDQQGNRVQRRDAAGHTTTYEYDRLGRESRRTLPDGKFETKSYDNAGNLTSRVDFAGQQTSYAYDNNDRLIEKSLPAGAPIAYTYSATGRRLTVNDARGVTTYTYDSRDRLSRKTDPTGHKLEYGYNGGGQRTSMQVEVGAASQTTRYGYDVAGRLTTVTDPGGRVFTMEHDPAGNPSRLARPNGVDTTWTHNGRNHLTNIRTFNRTTDATIAGYGYTLATTGHRTAILEADGTSRSYGYDALYRLTSENVTDGPGPQYGKTFGYDAVSNRTSQVTTGFGAGSVAYSYDSRQRLLTENGVAYTWDDNGNMLGKAGGDGYGWDPEDHLVRVTKSDGTVIDNTYDADGALVRMVTTPPGGPSTTTDYVVDTSGGLSHVVAEVTGGAVDVVYVRAGDMLLEEIRGGTPRYYEAEGIGSVRSLLDASGARTDTWSYSAFGEGLARTGTSVQPYQFAGERNVGSVGLYQNRARWLSTSAGRLVSEDPFSGFSELPISQNPFIYGLNDPVLFVDSSGRVSIAQVGISVAIGASLGAIASAGTEYARTGAVTVRGVLYGAAAGGVMGPVALAWPAAAAVLGVASASGSAITLGPLLADSSISPSRRASAAAVIVSSLFGARAGLRYANQVRARVVAPTSEPTILLYHKGELAGGQVSGNRSLSMGTSLESVSGLDRKGTVHIFEVPVRKLWEWRIAQRLREFKDLDQETGIVNEEIRVLPPTSAELNQFKKGG